MTFRKNRSYHFPTMFDFIVVKMRGKIRRKIELLFELNRLVGVPMFVTKQVSLFTWQFTVFYHRRLFSLYAEFELKIIFENLFFSKVFEIFFFQIFVQNF